MDGAEFSAKSPSNRKPFEKTFRLGLNLMAPYKSICLTLSGALLLIAFTAILSKFKAPDRASLDTGFSQIFLKQASANLSQWRQQLFLETIALQSATERSMMDRVQPEGHSRFDLFNPFVQCPKGERLQLFGGIEGSDGAKYLCPSLLTNSSHCVVYSLGSRLEFTFEEDILQRTGCQVVTFDCTVDGSSIHPRHTFLKKCLGNVAAMHANPDEWITLSEAMVQFGHSSITLLKIDIEGYEFDVLGAYTEAEPLPAMIAMEMHYSDLYWGTNAWSNREENRTLYWPGHGKLSLPELSLFMFHLGNLGYAVVSRDDNLECKHCSEFTLLKVE